MLKYLNKYITILNITVLGIAILSSIGWILELNILQEICYWAINIFFVLSFIHMLANSKLILDKYFLNIIILLVLLPIILLQLYTLFFEHTHFQFFVLFGIACTIGIYIVYQIWYQRKIIKTKVDSLKKWWVLLYCFSNIGSSLFKINHYPYQEYVGQIHLIIFIPLIISFYYQGIKDGFLETIN